MVPRPARAMELAVAPLNAKAYGGFAVGAAKGMQFLTVAAIPNMSRSVSHVARCDGVCRPG